MGKDVCLSTHGGDGYAPGTVLRSDGKVVCGACGEVLTPLPSGSAMVPRAKPDFGICVCGEKKDGDDHIRPDGSRYWLVYCPRWARENWLLRGHWLWRLFRRHDLVTRGN